MCGISVIVSTNEYSIKRDLISMTNIIRHRGPDDEGYLIYDNNDIFIFGGSDTPPNVYKSSLPYCPKNNINKESGIKGKIGLGHRRLSILDLEATGHQPMISKNGRYGIVYNGEIYNYLELKSELNKLGHEFVTNSDTEVILTSYSQWGVECQHKFNGMWAFVIYDKHTNEIFISRDRYGIKPLYYWFSNTGVFHAASEIKQFQASSNWKARLNHQRAYDYLFYSITDHTNETMFKNVFNIRPGCFYKGRVSDLITDLNQENPKDFRWYKPFYKGYNGTFENAKYQFRELFKSAIDIHLRADVPVGSALSGGLDSSAIVSYVNIILKRQNKPELQKTFSSCSSDPRYDEKIWMDEVVKHTNVNAYFIYPDGRNVFDMTEKILWHMDEPYQSQSAFLAYHVFEEAKNRNVKVLLNGQGADEYLSGYSTFRFLRQANMLKKFNFKLLFREIDGINARNKLIHTLKLLYDITPKFFLRYLSYKTDHYKTINSIVNSENLSFKRIHPYDVMKYRIKRPFDVSYHQILNEPLQKYLRWEDRNSMAHSVEARVPFLDYRLVEFTTQLPIDYLDGPNESKKILTNSMKGILSNSIINRKDKKGFITPEERWVKEDYREEFLKLFEENVEYSKGIINKNKAYKYIKNMQEGKEVFDYKYWHIILFCIWMKVFKVELEM